MTTSGVYQITNTINGKRYIGSAVDIENRRAGHWSTLQKNKHRNQRLQNSFNKHGSDVFVFRPIVICRPENVLMYEQICIDGLNPEYNICKTVNSLRGHKWSEESRSKMRGNKNGVGNPGRSRTGLYEHEKVLLSKRMMGNKYALGKRRFGEQTSGHKFTNEQVIAVRNDGRTYSIISKEYGMSIANISKIKNRKSWAHI
jgi:group I intron endonuclease